MNKQYRSPEKRGIEWTDFTTDTSRGCYHRCRWKMPNDVLAVCYAETTAERVAQGVYTEGFEHYYWYPQEMQQWRKLKPRQKCFWGSMTDNFGEWVPEAHIQMALDAIRTLPEVIFQTLTKNPNRARFFDIPHNLWVGCSTPPDEWRGHALDVSAKQRMFSTSLRALGDLKAKGVLTFISDEPANWNIFPALLGEAAWVADPYQCSAFDWIVVGAASDGKTYYPPAEECVRDVVNYCDGYSIPVFMKGNLRVLDWAKNNWREEFPDGS